MKFSILRLNATVKNLALSISSKLLVSAIGIYSVPILLKLLGVNQYGLWVTATSVLAWLTVFDFGVGYSLKNEVTRKLSVDDKGCLSKSVVGCYQFTAIISTLLILAILIPGQWIRFLSENRLLVLALYLPYLLGFPLTISISVLQGARKVGAQSLIASTGNLLWVLLLVCVLVSGRDVNLLTLAIAYSLFMVIQNYINYRLSIRYLDHRHESFLDLSNLRHASQLIAGGMRFFILQMVSIVLFGMGNYLVYTKLSSSQAAVYDTVNKLFQFGMSFFNIIISVLWPEFTHSINVNDIARVKKLFKSLLLIAMLFSIGSFALVAIVPFIVKIWTNGKLIVESHTVLFFAVLVSVQVVAYTGSLILNVVEKLKVQIYLSILSAVAFIPVTNIFFMNGYGIASIPVASAIVILPSMFYCLIASYKIINGAYIE